MFLSDYLKERNIQLDSLEANSIMEGFHLAEKVFGGIPKVFKVMGHLFLVLIIEEKMKFLKQKKTF